MDLSHIHESIAGMLASNPAEPMLFHSGLFWALFLAFMPLFALLRRRRVMMTLFVIAFSLYFYWRSSGWFVLLLVMTSLSDYYISRALPRLETRGGRRALTAFGIIISLCVLLFFKYANFFLWNWNAMVEGNFQPLDIALPLGISFYTFRSISYLVDVYKGTCRPASTWGDYLFFQSFFPALIAGPISRAGDFLPQLERRDAPTRREVYGGLWLIIAGVVKKAVFADYIAQYNNLVFDTPGAYNGFESAMGAIGYTVQIYCDFSGYSDIAIGLALVMGFHLGLNFDFPYRSRSLTEFWRRWHISLSSWLRDYVYIPLGGNRKGTVRTYINNFATMLIGGLWHGAAWKFVFWGAMHGAGLAVNKAVRPFTRRLDGRRWWEALCLAMTLGYVSFLWIFFRAPSWEASWQIVGNIFCNFDIAYALPFVSARRLWLVIMLAAVALQMLPRRLYDSAAGAFIASRWSIKLLIFVAVVQLVIEFGAESVSPFIYTSF